MKWILALWIVIATIAILGVGSTRQSAFDPSLKLAQQSMSLQYEKTLLSSLPVMVPLTTNHDTEPRRKVLYHINQGGCFCEWLMRKHRESLIQWSETKGAVNIDVKLQDYPQLAALIPSTPAIVAVDEWGKVIYLGPYARGSGCFAGSGQVDDYLQRWHQLSQADKHSHQPIIETDASGCYCAT